MTSYDTTEPVPGLSPRPVDAPLPSPVPATPPAGSAPAPAPTAAAAVSASPRNDLAADAAAIAPPAASPAAGAVVQPTPAATRPPSARATPVREETPLLPRTPSLLAALRRYPLPALLALALCLLAAVAVNRALPSEPTATARLGLSDPRGNSVFRQSNLPSADLARYVALRADLAGSQTVLQRAVQYVEGVGDVRELQEEITTSVETDADVLVVQATAPTPELAVQRANAVARAYREVSGEETAAQARAALRALGDGESVANRAAEIRLAQALYGDGVAYVNAASLDDVTDGVNTGRNLLIGLVLGLIAGVGLALLLALRRQPVEDPDSAYEALGAPLLAEVPRLGGRRSVEQQLETAATVITTAVPHGAVAITSSGRVREPGAVAAGLAVAAARFGTRVALVDASEKHGAARALGVDADGDASHRTTVDLGASSLQLLAVPAGEGAAAESRQLVDALRGEADLVVVHCPPLDQLGGAPLVRAADASLVLVRAGEPAAGLRKANHMLTLLDSPLLGFLLLRGAAPDVRGARVRQASPAAPEHAAR